MYLCTSREAHTISMHMIFRHNLWMDFGVFTFDVFVCLSLFRSVFIVHNVNVMYIRCDWCAAHLYAEMFFSERCTMHGARFTLNWFCCTFFWFRSLCSLFLSFTSFSVFPLFTGPFDKRCFYCSFNLNVLMVWLRSGLTCDHQVLISFLNMPNRQPATS